MDFEAEPAASTYLSVSPKWEPTSWWHLLSIFRVVKEYPAGERIFSAPKDDSYNTEDLETCATAVQEGPGIADTEMSFALAEVEPDDVGHQPSFQAGDFAGMTFFKPANGVTDTEHQPPPQSAGDFAEAIFYFPTNGVVGRTKQLPQGSGVTGI
ncbi:hypothetical protein CYMTET_47922 [Cymbomonas tetramitiformis]|uniref:Uncharacterized protein n=1 Tax=Cymbomonas tetramitiformis TaxID=36881 RepID=A0AAE0BV21_9CHLO|nr:hypothetical protein CYMTET_47922 [Cymbomonas tetramitiformis]